MKPLEFKQKMLLVGLFAALALSSTWSPIPKFSSSLDLALSEDPADKAKADANISLKEVKSQDVIARSVSKDGEVYLVLKDRRIFKLSSKDVESKYTKEGVLCLECADAQFRGSIQSSDNPFKVLADIAAAIEVKTTNSDTEKRQAKTDSDEDQCTDTTDREDQASCYKDQIRDLMRKKIPTAEKIRRLRSKKTAEKQKLRDELTEFKNKIRSYIKAYTQAITKAARTVAKGDRDDLERALDMLGTDGGAKQFVNDIEYELKNKVGDDNFSFTDDKRKIEATISLLELRQKQLDALDTIADRKSSFEDQAMMYGPQIAQAQFDAPLRMESQQLQNYLNQQLQSLRGDSRYLDPSDLRIMQAYNQVIGMQLSSSANLEDSRFDQIYSRINDAFGTSSTSALNDLKKYGINVGVPDLRRDPIYRPVLGSGLQSSLASGQRGAPLVGTTPSLGGFSPQLGQFAPTANNFVPAGPFAQRPF